MTRRRTSVALLVLVLVVCAALAMWWWPQAAQPEPRMERLADGVAAYFRTDSKLIPAQGYPNPREIHVDGDFFIRAPKPPLH